MKCDKCGQQIDDDPWKELKEALKGKAYQDCVKPEGMSERKFHSLWNEANDVIPVL